MKWDTYTFQARLTPALLVALPLGLLVASCFPNKFAGWGLLVSVLTTFGFCTLLAQIGRDLGKEKETESLIGQQSVRVAKAFQRAIVAIAKDTSQTPPRWKTGADALIGEIQNLCRLKYAVDDVQGAQFFVYELGHVLEAAALAARDAGETSEFERMIEDRFLPALAAARIHYESGLVSICDMLLTVGISQGLVSRLLNRVEKDYGESWSFKSGALMGLSGRYSRIGELRRSNSA